MIGKLVALGMLLTAQVILVAIGDFGVTVALLLIIPELIVAVSLMEG